MIAFRRPDRYELMMTVGDDMRDPGDEAPRPPAKRPKVKPPLRVVEQTVRVFTVGSRHFARRGDAFQLLARRLLAAKYPHSLVGNRHEDDGRDNAEELARLASITVEQAERRIAHARRTWWRDDDSGLWPDPSRVRKHVTLIARRLSKLYKVHGC